VADSNQSDLQLRDTVGESFNVFQSTVAMGSIFMGFVFAALLQMLGGNGPLPELEQWTARLLVAAMLLLLGGLLAFQATANQVIKYWGFFSPQSRVRTLGTVLFELGITTMLLSTTVMLWKRGLWGTGSVVGVAAVALFPVTYWIGVINRAGRNTKRID